MPLKKILTGCLLMTAVLLSCKKGKVYDITGDQQVKFFTNNANLGNTPVNSLSFGIVNIPDVAGSGWVNLSSSIPDTIKFPVFATKPVSADVVIGATLDNALIAEYNAQHGTSYAPFPDGILKTAGLGAQIKKGQTISIDSIYIPTDKTTLASLTERSYMAPIRLSTVSNTDAGSIVTSTGRVTYVVADLELRRIKFNAAAAEAVGSFISPRSPWTVVLSPTPNPTGSIVDGSNSSYSRFPSTPGQVDVDMQVEKNVTGIRLYSTTSSSNIPTQVEVYLSSDGINYDKIGSPLRADLTYASGYNYILFYKVIPARYLRLIVNYSTSTSTNNRRLAELDVYAN